MQTKKKKKINLTPVLMGFVKQKQNKLKKKGFLFIYFFFIKISLFRHRRSERLSYGQAVSYV